MKIFLSWSGHKSEKVASALRDWIPMILQYVEPWLSSRDIPMGTRWDREIDNVLTEVDYGIICLTKENLKSGWLNFEAGAISKNKQAKVIVFLIDVDYADLKGPFSQFQAVRASEKNDLKKMIIELNRATEKPMPVELVNNLFEHLYSGLESTIKDTLKEDIQNIIPDIRPLAVSTLDSLDSKVSEILNILQNQKDIFPKNEIIEKKKAESIKGKPKVFIGSSSEGLDICYAIQENLHEFADVTIWNQGIFNLSSTVIESIVDVVYNFDFAILVFTPDDKVVKRGVEYFAPRDNVIFELGLFIGTLGRGRTFLVYEKEAKIHIPSDMLGVTAATFLKRQDDNLLASLMPVCQRIKRAMGVADR